MPTNKENEAHLEARARRAARRVGLRVRKSRQRKHVPNGDNFGGLMLIDADRGFVVRGSRFELSVQDVIDICTEYEPT